MRGLDRVNAPALEFRGYKPDDLEAMFRLDELCFEPPFRFSMAAMRRFATARNARVSIAEISGVMAGFYIAEVNSSSGGKSGYIVTLDVAPEHRRKGVAEKLMREAEAQAVAAGCGAMLLHVFEGNDGAIRFYEHEGYAFYRSARHFYAPGVHALVYRKLFG